MTGYKKIYEDEWLLVVDKPAGLLSVPSPSGKETSLLGLLKRAYKESGSEILPCHRLDKETSGLVILAKGRIIQDKITDLFRHRRIKKGYIAVINGWMEQAKGEIRSYLSESPAGKKKLAMTRFRVVCRNPEYSVLEVEPLTGRKNQIRIHFKQMGHPIVGERRFAFARDFQIKTGRLCLHAQRLAFEHPVTGKMLNLVSPIPEPIRNFF